MFSPFFGMEWKPRFAAGHGNFNTSYNKKTKWVSGCFSGTGWCLRCCVRTGMLSKQMLGCVWRTWRLALTPVWSASLPLWCVTFRMSPSNLLEPPTSKESASVTLPVDFCNTQASNCHLELHNWILLAAPLNLNPPKLSERELEREYIISAATAAYSLNTECLK